MKNRLKYFIFNKTRDYAGGCLEQLECGPDGLRVSRTGGRGAFISRILDSREKDMQWHRLVFDIGGSTSFKLTVFAANSVALNEGGTEDLHQLIRDPHRTFAEKMAQMEPFVRKQETKAGDILLHDVAGRYLWLAVELFGTGGQEAEFQHLQVYFPRQTWLDYLPEVYAAGDDNGFLERYLAIFQTLHEQMNRSIREFPARLDVDSAGQEYLIWLSQWLDIAGSYMWSEEQLRKLLRDGIRLYRRRGTRAGILEFIRLYTGGEAYLVEYPRIFTVIIRKEYVPTRKDYQSLLRVIDEVKPAQMECELVVLEPYMFLGSHTYMGINSAFGEYREMVLDGLSMMPFAAIHSSGAHNEEKESRR